MKALTKTIETINNTALAVISAPEAIRELRVYAVEANGRKRGTNEWFALHRKLDEGAARVSELETEVRKLTEANQDAASELNRARADAASMRLEVERLQSEVVRLSAPVGHGEPAIPEPGPGEGFELCTKDDATGWTLATESNGAVEWFEWSPMNDPSPCFSEPENHYAFRRPIAKPEPKWVACTAEEAMENPGESQTFAASSNLDAGKFDWRDCSGYPCGFDPGFAYRTTAPLPLEIAVTKSVWDRAPKEAQLFARLYSGAPAYRLMRRHLPDGFRLDAP